MNEFFKKGLLIFVVCSLLGAGLFVSLKATAETAVKLYCASGGYHELPVWGLEVETDPEELVLYPSEFKILPGGRYIGEVGVVARVDYSGDKYTVGAGKYLMGQGSYVLREGGERLKVGSFDGVLVIDGAKGNYELNPLCGYRVVP